MKTSLKESLQAIRLKTIHETVLNNPYIPHKPTDKQFEFLFYTDILEGFYGGATGGGKSDALLMAALQFAEVPGYSALLLRRTYADLSLPEALMDRAQEWLSGTGAKWHADTKTWAFPSGASLTFGYLDHERSKYRYQGAAFQFIGFDEVTQFPETAYQYLFSRLRRLEDSHVPIRMRAASNPGDIGHDWVKRRFIIPTCSELTAQKRFFVPAYLEDNPHIDQITYDDALNKLDPVTREQLRHGDWDVSISGGLFERAWFGVVDTVPRGDQVRFWDLAATEAKKGSDPDWTVGVLMVSAGGAYYVKDVIRMRKKPGDIEAIIRQTAQMDGIETRIFMEQEPGSSGKGVVATYAKLLAGYAFYGIPSSGSKTVRAQPLSAAASRGDIKVLNGVWLNAFMSELEIFPNGAHDDQVDAVAAAYSQLALNVMIDSPLPTPGAGASRFMPR
jgi:predicted phage terminase large subunit-like protein